VEKREKELFIASMRSALDQAGLVVVTRQVGLTVDESQGLRRKMYEAGAQFKVTKNTLTKLAVKGTSYEVLGDHLKGPTALAYSSDPIAAARVVVKFANDNQKLEIVCGAMGDKFLSKADLNALATLPSLDELRGKIIGILQAPAGKLARVVQAPAGQLARVVSAYSKKG